MSIQDDQLRSSERTSSFSSLQRSTLSAGQLPPGILKRQSSTSTSRSASTSTTSRRSNSQHRSPMLSAQPDPVGPQRFSNSQHEKQDMLNAMEAEEEVRRPARQKRDRRLQVKLTLLVMLQALVNHLSRKLENVRSYSLFCSMPCS